LGEHQLDKLGVTGSSPVPPIKALQIGAFLNDDRVTITGDAITVSDGTLAVAANPR
jgi:hypothetical protein